MGEEVIFDKENDNNYVVHYCSDNTQKTLRFNVNDCNKCYCTMYWYDGNEKSESGIMECRAERMKIKHSVLLITVMRLGVISRMIMMTSKIASDWIFKRVGT